MKNKKPTIDDMIFEDRNREYGSYHLRKRFHIRLFIGFISSLLFILSLSLGYFWYLYKAGDENLYLYSTSNSAYLKSVQGNLLSPGELSELVSRVPPPAEKLTEVPVLKKATPVQSFRVTENPSDIQNVRPLNELITNEETGDDDMGLLLNDSTAFGGFLSGEGFGGGGMYTLPVFPDGDATKYVERNLRYPAMAIKQKIHGTVIVTFIISKTGHVTDVKVERGVNPVIDDEAVKTIRNMPPWRPGMMHGKPVNFLFRMPINFVPLS